MATLSELEHSGHLSKWEVDLRPPQQEERLIYVSPRLTEWLERDLPPLVSSWDLEETPLQQVYAFVSIFIAGDTLVFCHQFSPLRPIGDGAWELKTADVRIFGWFPIRDCFVGVSANEAWRVKASNLYAGYRGEVVRFRNELALDEPKFVEGDDPNAVVSAFDYPP